LGGGCDLLAHVRWNHGCSCCGGEGRSVASGNLSSRRSSSWSRGWSCGRCRCTREKGMGAVDSLRLIIAHLPGLRFKMIVVPLLVYSSTILLAVRRSRKMLKLNSSIVLGSSRLARIFLGLFGIEEFSLVLRDTVFI